MQKFGRPDLTGSAGTIRSAACPKFPAGSRAQGSNLKVIQGVVEWSIVFVMVDYAGVRKEDVGVEGEMLLMERFC